MTEAYKIDELRSKLDHLLKEQSETLNSRASGGASDAEILEFDLRQELIGEIEERIARSSTA